MDAFSRTLGKSSADGDSPHRLGKLSNSSSNSAGHKADAENHQTPVTAAVTHPHAAGLGGSRAEVPPCWFGDHPLLSKGTHSLQPGLPVFCHHWDRAHPSVLGMFPPHHGEPRRHQGALSVCSTANTHFRRGGLEKAIDPQGKATLGPPKQHGQLVPRGVPLKVGSEQLPVPPGPPQKGAGHHCGICCIHQRSRQHSSSHIPCYIPTASPMLF